MSGSSYVSCSRRAQDIRTILKLPKWNCSKFQIFPWYWQDKVDKVKELNPQINLDVELLLADELEVGSDVVYIYYYGVTLKIDLLT